jgi:hypothetical protein
VFVFARGAPLGPFVFRKGFTMQLQPHERHMACLLSGLLVGLSLVVLRDHRPSADFSCEKISVHIVGAVDEATLSVNEGTILEDLLQLAHVHDDADLSELDGQRRVTNGQVVVVPYAGKTTVYVTGAVEEAKVVTVPKEAGPKDVLQAVNVREDAIITYFLRRKRIKNGDVIEFKAKKSGR